MGTFIATHDILLQECGVECCSSNKSLVAQGIGLHFSILRCKAELDQLKNGLENLGVLNAIEAFPELMKVFFVLNTKKLTAG